MHSKLQDVSGDTALFDTVIGAANHLVEESSEGTHLHGDAPERHGRNKLQGAGTATLDLLWGPDLHQNHGTGEDAKLLNLGGSA